MVHMAVLVTDSSGQPWPNIGVAVQLHGIKSGFTPDVMTDRDGVSRFSLDIGASDKITIFAKGSVRYEGYPEAKLYISI